MSIMGKASAKEIDIANVVAASEEFDTDPVGVYHTLLGEHGTTATARIWRVATQIWERDRKGGD
jgi:hypothetical protein